MKIAVTVDIGEADAREFADMIADALRRKKEEEKRFRVPDQSEVRTWMEEAAAEKRCGCYNAEQASKIFFAHYAARSWQCGGRLIADPKAKAREWAFKDIAELEARNRKPRTQRDDCFSSFDIDDFVRLAEQRTFGG